MDLINDAWQSLIHDVLVPPTKHKNKIAPTLQPNKERNYSILKIKNGSALFYIAHQPNTEAIGYLERTDQARWMQEAPVWLSDPVCELGSCHASLPPTRLSRDVGMDRFWRV